MALSTIVSRASKSRLVLPFAHRAISCAGSLFGSATAPCEQLVEHNIHGFVHQSRQFSTIDTAKKALDDFENLLNSKRVLSHGVTTLQSKEFEKLVDESSKFLERWTHDLNKYVDYLQKSAGLLDDRTPLARQIETVLDRKRDQMKDEALNSRPVEFPFTIIINRGERDVKLTRDFQGEFIEVKVGRAKVENFRVDEDYSSYEETGSDSDQDKKNAAAVSLPMTVTVTKKDGKRLRFELTASVDKIDIKRMAIEEAADSVSDSKVEFSGPDFEQLDGDLQHSLLIYLENRGIKTDFIGFLHKYLVSKSKLADVIWLFKLYDFVVSNPPAE